MQYYWNPCQVWIPSWELDIHYHAVWSNFLPGFNTQLGDGHSLSLSLIEYPARFEYPSGSLLFIIMDHYRISCHVWISSWGLDIHYHAVLLNILPGLNNQLGVGHSLSCNMIEYPARSEYTAENWTFFTMQLYWITYYVWISNWELVIQNHAVWSNILPDWNIQQWVDDCISR